MDIIIIFYFFLYSLFIDVISILLEYHSRIGGLFAMKNQLELVIHLLIWIIEMREWELV
jgi:hypothetical protein